MNLDEALKTVRAAGYRVSKPKPKKQNRGEVGPTCVVTFADGEVCRMTTHCSDDKPDFARGIRLCAYAWSSRTGFMHEAAQPIIVHFERDGEIIARQA